MGESSKFGAIQEYLYQGVITPVRLSRVLVDQNIFRFIFINRIPNRKELPFRAAFFITPRPISPPKRRRIISQSSLLIPSHKLGW